MRKKGEKGEPSSPQGHVGPKPQLGPPEPILTINSLDTKMAIEPVGPNFRHGPYFQPWPLETTRGHQTSSESIPLNLRGILPFLQAPRTQGCRSRAYMVLYTIMHHFCSAIQL
ncbi:hypothetical protein O181_107437 [Austropuccinia psidii MF-1]|uniref:Uncharacterized protein n=1 Tax=Austropuccinia psidii MF-1 TaxID=1389203 RepID=A0A9Q3JTY7_9BASI|nr:hypothetical protein [Austropuccinia psidii MF-1]